MSHMKAAIALQECIFCNAALAFPQLANIVQSR